MPTIAFVMQAFYGDQIGGAERQVQLLAKALRDHGWRTAYICERAAEKPLRENVAGMEVFALLKRGRRWAIRNAGDLKKAVLDSRADLLYQRIRHPYTGLIARIASQAQRPFVWAAASTADVIRSTDLRATSKGLTPLDWLMHPWVRRLEDFGILRADAVVLQTDEQAHLLEENYGRRGVVIPNHIPRCEEEIISRSEPPEVLWISNIKSFKRPELFLELARRCSDLNARFVMVGDCQQEYLLDSIQQAQRQLSNFSYLGPLEPELADLRIAAATVLVNTSKFEGFPNAFQQAWRRGVPTISLEVDPDNMIMREGLGSCSRSMDQMEADLRKVLGDEIYRLKVAVRASHFACRSFDLATLLPKYLTLFEDLIKR